MLFIIYLFFFNLCFEDISHERGLLIIFIYLFIFITSLKIHIWTTKPVIVGLIFMPYEPNFNLVSIFITVLCVRNIYSNISVQVSYL